MRLSPVLLLALAASANAAPINAVPNSGFEVPGENGSLVTENAPLGLESAADEWRHFYGVLGSSMTTELVASTDPLPGGGGMMLRFTTDAGFVASAGNGVFVQILARPVGSLGYIDINVTDGTTGVVGFVNDLGALDSGSVAFGPSSGWVRLEFENLDSASGLLGFEIFSNGGGEMLVDNVFVAASEPGTMALLVAGCLFASGRRPRQSALQRLA